jgi:polar amino acid transport system substrate-binding protein
MKRFVALGIVLTMAVSLAACGKKETKVISSIDDLEGAKIGVQSGTTGETYAEGEYGADALNRYDTGAEAVLALTQGKVDAVIIDDQPAQVFVGQNEGLYILEEEFTVEDYAICIAKENTELKDQINAAIAQIKENGTFQTIIDYYIGKVEGTKRYVAMEIEREGQLIMATNAAFPPYELREGDGFAGVDVDMAQAIADILGKELVINDMDFDSIIASVQTGKADIGCAGMTVTEDRLLSIDFTDSYYTGRQVVIVKK